MQIRVTVKGRGLEQMLRITQKIAAFDRGDLMRRLGQRVLQQHIKRITAEKTDPDGKAWAALAPSTVAQKGNSNILVRTGRMAGAFRLRSSSMRAEVSNPTPYLKYHETGTRKPMPRRKVMGISTANLAELQAILNQTIARLLR